MRRMLLTHSALSLGEVVRNRKIDGRCRFEGWTFEDCEIWFADQAEFVDCELVNCRRLTTADSAARMRPPPRRLRYLMLTKP
jgi:hypothetical protein